MSAIPWPASRINRDLQWKVLYILQPPADAIPWSSIILSSPRRNFSRREQSSPPGLHIVGIMAPSSQRYLEPVLDGRSARFQGQKCLEMDRKWRWSRCFLLESASRLSGRLRALWWKQRLALVRHSLYCEAKLHLPAP